MSFKEQFDRLVGKAATVIDANKDKAAEFIDASKERALKFLGEKKEIYQTATDLESALRLVEDLFIDLGKATFYGAENTDDITEALRLAIAEANELQDKYDSLYPAEEPNLDFMFGVDEDDEDDEVPAQTDCHVYCTKCGAAHLADENFCSKCGTVLKK